MAEISTVQAGLSFETRGEAGTAALAVALAPLLRVGDVVALQGDLGAGKTSFARALINALPLPGSSRPAERPEPVPSPTFTLVQIYEREPAAVWHFDLFRLIQPEEAFELGVDEAFATAICLVEWPERLGPFLPRSALGVLFAFAAGPDTRRIAFEGAAPWPRRLAELRADG